MCALAAFNKRQMMSFIIDFYFIEVWFSGPTTDIYFLNTISDTHHHRRRRRACACVYCYGIFIEPKKKKWFNIHN